MKKYLKCIICLILLIFLCGIALTSLASSPTSIEVNTDTLSLYSDCLLLVEKETGDILYEKNAYNKMYPASTTKLLTAIIVLENCYLNEVVTVSSTAISAVPSGYVKAPLYAGEELRVEDLLYTMLIPSANDAANVLAEHVAGSISAFADLMNKKAEEIGITSSHFTNPSGIHDANLYTTAYDLSLIARYAMNNETLMEIVRTEKYTIPSNASHLEEDRTFYNSNLLLEPSETNYYYEYATGMKTGFTDAAGDCLVASAKKDDVEFIAICLGSGYLQNGLREKFLDCKTLFDFAFDNYTTYYKNLQEEKLKDLSNNTEISLFNAKEMENTLNDTNLLRTLSKIIAIIILIMAIKILFFRKKSNRRKSFKKKK